MEPVKVIRSLFRWPFLPALHEPLGTARARCTALFSLLIPFLILFLLVCPLLADPDKPDAYELNDEGIQLLKNGKYDEAIRAFREALKYLPANDTIRKNLAGAYGKAGEQKLRRKETAAAVEMLKQAVFYDAEREDVGLLYGSALKQAGLLWEAESEFRRLIRIFPRSSHAYTALGHLLYEKNEVQEAVDCWKKAFALNPEDKQLLKWLEKGQREAAVEGEFAQLENDNFDIRFDGKADSEVGYLVLSLLDEAYSQLGGDWDFYPEKPVPVILYSKTDFKTVTQSFGWVGGVYDGKIRIPVKNLPRKEVLRKVIFHEYTHVLVHRISPHCPIWLNEGIAQLEEGKGSKKKTPILSRALAQGSLLPLERLPRTFAREKDARKVELFYAQSLSFVEFLASEYGKDRVITLLMLLGKKKRLSAAVQEAFGNELGELEKEWRRTLE